MQDNHALNRSVPNLVGQEEKVFRVKLMLLGFRV